jgi:Ca2+-transporting ATPase
MQRIDTLDRGPGHSSRCSERGSLLPPRPENILSSQDATTDAAGGAGDPAEAVDAARASQGPSWHALDVEEVLEKLDTSERGLDGNSASERLKEHGENRLEPEEPVSDIVLLVRQFKSPLILILLVATVVTLLIQEYADSAVIVAVLILNAVIGFTQERRADRSVQALMSLASPEATVRRDGSRRRIDAAELVPGDIVLLEAGDRVPADLRLIEASALRADESLLTGESDPVRKSAEPVDEDELAADRSSMVHMGTNVASGRGVGVAVATGTSTLLGAIAERMSEQERPPTPLQLRMNRFANIIAAAVIGSTVIAFTLGVALGGEVGEMFLVAVALAVAVVPEGLPVAFTIAMALGVRRMARRRVIVRTLPAVETLGSTTVIGSDKTGTLTENRMSIVAGWTSSGWFHLGADTTPLHDDSLHIGAAEDGEANGDENGGSWSTDAIATMLRTGVLANDAYLTEEGGSGGDPTEVALLHVAAAVEIDPEQLREDTDVLVDVPFSSDQQFSYAITDEDGPLMRLKGAPERVVELAAHLLGHDGEHAPIDADAVLDAARMMAERGLRVLAFAQARLDSRPDPNDPPEPKDLVLTGLVGMQDPPREGVRDAIARCRSAGIRVLMITGDHPATAQAIAADLGITDADGAEVITGTDVEGADDDALGKMVANTPVFARVAPEHKLRIVQALQSQGAVVAVTGDGVNDAPALKAANIGVAMGRDGTDVAREASDMVLTDDNFVAIVAAVEEGRVVFDNVRKVTYFLLSTGVAAIAAILTAIATGLPLPYTPAALLWLNVVTNGLQDVALAFELGEPDTLKRSPREESEGIVSRALWERTVLTGLTMAGGSLWLYTYAISQGLSEDAQRGAALTTFVVAMALHAYNARSERRSIVASDPRTNPLLLGAVIGALVLHVGALYWGPTQALLRIGPFGLDAWWRMAVVALSVVAVSEIHKFARRVGEDPR